MDMITDVSKANRGRNFIKIPDNVREELVEAVKAKGLNGYNIAEKLNIKSCNVYRYFNGNLPMSFDVAQRIGKIVGFRVNVDVSLKPI